MMGDERRKDNSYYTEQLRREDNMYRIAQKDNGIKPQLCDGWRDVRKELPEIGVAVLIMVTCLSYHNIEQGTYKGGDEWVNCWFSIRDKESYPVTHWMPLPDPPAFA